MVNRLGWDRLETMLYGLPTNDSLFMTAWLGAENTSWDRTHHMLATVIDRLAFLVWETQRANPRLEAPKDAPPPIPRPGSVQAAAPERKAALTPEEFKAKMSRPRVALDSTTERR